MLDLEISAALEAAEVAGLRLLRHFRSSIASEEKGGGEPVSIADRESDAMIREHLRRVFPEDALLTEEGADDLARLAARRVWIVDPLDGTKDFLDGTDEFAVHIGLAVDGRPALGVVHRPARQQTYVGIPGEGARVRLGTGGWSPIRVSSRSADWRVVVTRSHPSAETRRLLDALEPSETLRCGSSGIKCAMVAEGQCELYLAVTDRMKEWDLCAPEAIVAAAGGRCSDLLGRPLRYNQPEPDAASGFLATSGSIHDAVIAKLAPAAMSLPWLRREA